MKIDRHISELLYDHDCVIVPAFGGFLASYQPAQLQPLQHTFYPPSKKIAFNVFLKNNDGLLANHIANKEKLTYAEAIKNIERFRTEVVSLLESGKRIVIEDVGTLYYDKQRNLQFEPAKTINYLEEAFGLNPVQSPPVKREEQRKKMERQIREAVAIRSSVKPPRVKAPGKRLRAKKILNTLALSGALIWFSLNIWLITDDKANLSSLSPFSFSSAPAKVETSTAAPKTESVKSGSAEATPGGETGPMDNILADKEPVPDNSLTVVIPPSHAGKANVLESIVQEQKNFFIIAGVFREPGNAERFVETLKKEGFDNAEIVNPSSEVKKVCYGSFAFRSNAEAALREIRVSKKDGWIFEK